MTELKKYLKIKEKQPKLNDCFFAFSNEQFAEGKKKIPEGEKIYFGGMGLYGIKEGIKAVYDFYEAVNKEIAETCNPQVVYDYEFNNHECGYTNDDTEVIKIVVAIFGEDLAAKVKRRRATVGINDLNFKIL